MSFKNIQNMVTGFVIGNAGLYETVLQFLIAYGIIFFTVSSVCAIATNGEVEGGGAYCILLFIFVHLNYKNNEGNIHIFDSFS